MTTARTIVVRGRVQGVFFRASVRERAEAVGVAGWARNMPDGSVEVHAEGDAEAVDAVEAFCRSGPPAARVDEVATADTAVRGIAGFACT